MRQEEQQVTQDHPEAVRSTPVPVPPPGDHADTDRPYADHAGTSEDALDDRDAADDRDALDDRRDAEADPDETRTYDTEDRRDATDRTDDEQADDRTDGDDPTDGDREAVYHEPAPLPTAFGATTVGDAVAASALAGGRPQDERDARDEDTAAPGDGAPGRTDPLDDERADPTAGDRLHDRDRWAGDDESAAGHADDPTDTPGDDTATAGAVGYGSAEPGLVDPDAEPVPVDADDTDRHHDHVDADTATAAAAGAAAGAGGAALAGADRPTPGAVPADAATLLAPEAAQGFRDRWRDVQLRFVDDPRAAVGEAESLVAEAMEALSAALAEQRTRLGAWQQSGSSDTEQLRVAVRGYRDFLDRVLGR
ncbi:hypothetical protein [Micromonospora sp. DT31]|uniref:hypothetical protein n=1 Tax=Micromonospora sp. DT31 TaxID=3393434 RepID=UPI003CF54109